MRKSIEMKKKLEDLRDQIEALQGEGKIQEAKGMIPDLKELKNQLDVQEALEAAEFKNFAGAPASNLDKIEKNKLESRILNKLVLDRKLTDEEAEYLARTECVKDAAGTPGQVGATLEKGGYLIPTEQFNRIIEFRRAFTQLKNFVTVRQAASRHGQQPTVGEENGQLTEFEELNEIHQSDIDFAQITYTINTYGDIIPVARELLADADADLIGLIGRRFARKAVNTENAKILESIDKLTKTAGKDYKAIQTALNKTLDPEISATARIFTNQSGFDYLDSLEDNNKRLLLTVSLADQARRLFKGRPVEVLKDTLLASDGAKLPFVVGSLADYITFFERQGVEIATSAEAGFTKNAILIRAIERFGITEVDKDAVTYLQIDTTGA